MKPTIATMFHEAAARGADRPALLYKSDGSYVPLTWREYSLQVDRMASWLISIGLAPGARVALMCETRYEWVIADMAMHQAALVNVPIYPTLPPLQAAYILQDSGAEVVIVSGRKLLDTVMAIIDDCPDLRRVVMIGDAAMPDISPTVHRWTECLSQGAALEAEMAPQRLSRQAEADPDGMCSIIYTSGTTGVPKGVMLSHDNFLSNARTINQLIGIGPEDTAISFLPLSHVLERVEYYAMTMAGATIGYAESLDSVATDLLALRPTLMATVPRLLEKVYTRVNDGVMKGSALKRHLFAWAIDVGRRHRLERRSAPLRYALADKLVFSKIRARLGGRMRTIVCGSAPLAKPVGEFFHIVGLAVCEGYGLTETSPVVTLNLPGQTRFGTVGPVIPGVTVKITDDGEICVKGPNVMLGYYKLPEANAAVFDADGWFRTGDVGEMDADGYLRITDRIKELIVLSNGKKVASQPIENRLKTSPYIEQALVVGDNRHFCTCLIVPNLEALKVFALSQGIPADKSDLLAHPGTLALLQAEIDRTTQEFARFEQVKKFTLLADEWTVETGEMTPTLKCKRKVILKNYAEKVDAMYTDSRPAVV